MSHHYPYCPDCNCDQRGLRKDEAAAMVPCSRLNPIHKFNGGKGATLCHNCQVIINEGFSERIYCDSCDNAEEQPLAE